MKVLLLFLILLPQEVQYSRGVLSRPHQGDAETTKALTREQRAEIQLALSKVKTIRAELRAAEAELVSLLLAVRGEQGVSANWIFAEDTLRFVKPEKQK